MGSTNLSGVITTPLKQIAVPDGDVLHAMKKTDPGFEAFGEAYFSMIHPGHIKGWKQHTEMVMNLVVPIGAVRFVLYDDRSDSLTDSPFQQVLLSRENYQRLTIPPHVWVAFQGLGGMTSLILNIASIGHDPKESRSKPLTDIAYPWESHNEVSSEGKTLA